MPEQPEAESTGEVERSFRPPKEPSLVATSLSILGVGLALYLLVDGREDLAYWLSSPQAEDLGGPADFHRGRFEHNRFARLTAIPGSRAGWYDRWEFDAFAKRRYEVLAVPGTELVVRRAVAGPALPRAPDKASEAPKPEPFTVEGRLERDDRMPEAFVPAFRVLAERGELVRKDHAWLLLEGERPRSGWSTPALTLVLVAFLVGNAVALARAHFRRNRPILDDAEPS